MVIAVGGRGGGKINTGGFNPACHKWVTDGLGIQLVFK